MEAKPIPIVFCGGTRAAHLAAGLAVADELAKLIPAARMIFTASGRHLTTPVEAAGYQRRAVSGRGEWTGAVRFLTHRWSDYHAARRWLRKIEPAVVVGLGGGDGVPVARAAVRMGVPLVVLEADVAPSSVTRSLSRWASLVCVGFADTRRRLNAACPARVTGVPVPAALHRARWVRHVAAGQAKRLLVLADAHGVIDAQLPRALSSVRGSLSGWKIVHQTTHRDRVAASYRELGLPAMVAPAAVDVAGLVLASDLVVSHAGGATLAGIAAAGAPALVVCEASAGPNSCAQNAATYGSAGVCVPLVHDDAAQLLPRLTAVLPRLLANPEHRRRLSQAAPHLARPDAAWRVAVTVRDLVARDRRQAA